MIKRVISGGQTGVDRTGLEVARELGIPTGGTAPKGWRIDGGADPSLADFGLVESPYDTYPPRTRENVVNSDATVLFGNMESPGCKLTIKLCKQNQRVYLCNPTEDTLKEWIEENDIKVLNVAGNRLRTNPVASITARDVLKRTLVR